MSYISQENNKLIFFKVSKSLLPLLSFVNTGKQKKESCFSDFLSKLWESQWSVEMVCYEGVNGWKKKKEKNPDKMKK